MTQNELVKKPWGQTKLQAGVTLLMDELDNHAEELFEFNNRKMHKLHREMLIWTIQRIAPYNGVFSEVGNRWELMDKLLVHAYETVDTEALCEVAWNAPAEKVESNAPYMYPAEYSTLLHLLDKCSYTYVMRHNMISLITDMENYLERVVKKGLDSETSSLMCLFFSYWTDYSYLSLRKKYPLMFSEADPKVLKEYVVDILEKAGLSTDNTAFKGARFHNGLIHDLDSVSFTCFFRDKAKQFLKAACFPDYPESIKNTTSKGIADKVEMSVYEHLLSLEDRVKKLEELVHEYASS